MWKTIKSNRILILFGAGIIYLITILGLSVYNRSIQPQIISTFPDNYEKDVKTSADIKVEFNRVVDKDDLELIITPSTIFQSVTTHNNSVNFNTDRLNEKTIYKATLKYKDSIIYTWSFATTGTGLLSFLGQELNYSEELFDISILDDGQLLIYVKEEPYEENKQKAIEFIDDNDLNPEWKNIIWYAPMIEENLEWRDILGPMPDGAP